MKQLDKRRKIQKWLAEKAARQLAQVEAEQNYRQSAQQAAAAREKKWRRHAKVTKEKAAENQRAKYAPGGVYASLGSPAGGNKISGRSRSSATLPAANGASSDLDGADDTWGSLANMG